MKEQYRIIGVQHSGRKGIRGTNRSDSKYDNMVGCTAVFDYTDIKQFEPFLFALIDHPLYEWWNISEVLLMSRYRDTGNLIIETVNTIYYFEKLSVPVKVENAHE